MKMNEEGGMKDEGFASKRTDQQTDEQTDKKTDEQTEKQSCFHDGKE